MIIVRKINDMDKWWDRSGYYDNITWVLESQYMDEFIFMMGLKGSEKILDVGCGTGIVLKNLRGRYPKLSLYGVDNSEGMMRMAGAHNFYLRIADATNLPYEDKAFDVVFARMILHHLLDSTLEKTLNEMKRVTRKTIVIAESVPIRDDLIEDIKYILDGKEDRRYFTGEGIVKLVENIGLKDIKKKDVILKSQSINNWLDNTKTTEVMKKKILERHHTVSDEYKKVANFKFTDKDIFSDMRHIIVVGKI